LKQQLEAGPVFREGSYGRVDLAGLAAFTLKWLQDRSIPTTFENVVVAAFRFFPTKFSLEGYKEYPDAARVNRSLLQLGPKYRNWARGSVQKGYVLTESGREKVRSVQATLDEGTGAEAPASARRKTLARTMDLTKELEPLEKSPLFSRWKRGQLDQGTSLELLNMLDAYAYTPPRALRARMDTLENAASQVSRDDLIEFLHAVRRTFTTHFRSD
jgi:hypothetical protein